MDWECKLFNSLIKLIRNDQKSQVSYVIKIDQSQTSHGKIASKGKMQLTAK